MSFNSKQLSWPRLLCRVLLAGLISGPLLLPQTLLAAGAVSSQALASARVRAMPPAEALNPGRGLGYFYILGIEPHSSAAEAKTAAAEALRWFDAKNPLPWFEAREISALEAQGRAWATGNKAETAGYSQVEIERAMRRFAMRIALLSAVHNNPNFSEGLNFEQRLALLRGSYSPEIFERARFMIETSAKFMSDANLRTAYLSAWKVGLPLALPAPSPKTPWSNLVWTQVKEVSGKAIEFSHVKVQKMLSGRLQLEATAEDGRKYRLAFKTLTPEEILNQSPEKIVMGMNQGYLKNLSIQALTFWLALGYFGGQYKTMLDYPTNPVALEQRLDAAFSPVTPLSILSFFVTRDFVQSKLDGRAVRRQERLIQLYSNNPALYERAQSPARKIGRTLFSGMGLTSLGIGIVAAGVVQDLGQAVISCNKMVSRERMDNRERERHTNICNQAWSEWTSGEAFLKYGPMILSVVGVAFLIRIIQASMLATPKVIEVAKKASKPGQARTGLDPKDGKYVEPKFSSNVSHSPVISKTPEPPGKEIRLPGLEPKMSRFGKFGGKATMLGLTIRLVGAHPVVQLVIQIGLQTIVLDLLERSYKWFVIDVFKPARIGSTYGKALQELEGRLQDLRLDRKDRLVKTVCNPGEEDNCYEENLIRDSVKNFAAASQAWRSNRLSHVYEAYNNWTDFMYTAANRYHAAKTFYRDVIEQVAEQRKKGFAVDAKRPNSWIYENSFQELPLFRSSPLFGVGDEVVQVYFDSKEKLALREEIKNRTEADRDHQIQFLPELEYRSVAEREAWSKKIEHARLAGEWLKGELEAGRAHNSLKVFYSDISSSLISGKVESMVSAIEQLNRHAMQSQALCERYGQGEGVYPSFCLSHAVLNQLKSSYSSPTPLDLLHLAEPSDQRVQGLSIPYDIASAGLGLKPMVLGPGVKYLSQYEFKLTQKGIDANTYPERSSLAHNRSMAHWLVTEMVCGRDPEAGEKLVDEHKGYKLAWRAPRIVRPELKQFCREQLARGANLGESLFSPQNVRATGKTYLNLVHLLYGEMKADLSVENFDAWWDQYVQPEYQAVVDRAEVLYQEKVIDEQLKPLLNEDGFSKVTQNKTISGGVSLPLGLGRALDQEFDFYLNRVLGQVLELGLSRREIPGLHERFRRVKSELLRALPGMLPKDKALDQSSAQSFVSYRKSLVELAEIFSVSTQTEENVEGKESQVLPLAGHEKELVFEILEQMMKIDTECSSHFVVLGALEVHGDSR